MKKKNILVFDFDGTLVNSTKLENDSLLYALSSVNISSVDEESIFSYYGPTEKGILKYIIGKEDIEPVWNTFLDYYKKNSKNYIIHPTILKLLVKLKMNPDLSLFLVTGRSKETLQISLQDNQLEDFFIKEYTGSEEGINKDESILQLIHDYGLEKPRILYIGDTVADINTMKKIDVDVLSVAYYKTNEECERLNILNNGKVCTKIDELEEYINYFI